MKMTLMFSLFLIATSDALAIPTLTEASATGTTVKFTTKLSEKLPTGFKVKIDYGNGKGLVAMSCSGLTCSLSSNALPVCVSPVTYKTGIYDQKGILQGTTIEGTYVISSIAVTSVYIKISNSGAVLPFTAKLGAGQNDWACTKDYKSGLIWEIKTTDGGLRDMNETYSNYFDVDTSVFINAVNKLGLCGAKNWRLPKIDELMKLVYCSDGKYEPNGRCRSGLFIIDHPTIDTIYFPNTNDGDYPDYWSSSPSPDGGDGFYASSWYVNFTWGKSASAPNYMNSYIRLVH